MNMPGGHDEHVHVPYTLYPIPVHLPAGHDEHVQVRAQLCAAAEAEVRGEPVYDEWLPEMVQRRLSMDVGGQVLQLQEARLLQCYRPLHAGVQ